MPTNFVSEVCWSLAFADLLPSTLGPAECPRDDRAQPQSAKPQHSRARQKTAVLIELSGIYLGNFKDGTSAEQI